MSIIVKRFLGTVALAMLLLALTRAGGVTAAQSLLQGARQITTPGMAGLFIVSGTHCSMMVASPDRPDIADLSVATGDEMRALYGPMIANTGVFEIAGNQ